MQEIDKISFRNPENNWENNIHFQDEIKHSLAALFSASKELVWAS